MTRTTGRLEGQIGWILEKAVTKRHATVYRHRDTPAPTCTVNMGCVGVPKPGDGIEDTTLKET